MPEAQITPAKPVPIREALYPSQPFPDVIQVGEDTASLKVDTVSGDRADYEISFENGVRATLGVQKERTPVLVTSNTPVPNELVSVSNLLQKIAVIKEYTSLGNNSF